ncbi:MAG: hypothetical protein Q4G58_16310 [bacterium]|nr:hypothetical protein [bacterium]
MNELRRIGRNKKFLAFVIVIVVLNSFLFYKEQQDRVKEQEINESVWTVAKEYREQIGYYKDTPVSEITKKIEAAKSEEVEWNAIQYALTLVSKEADYLSSYPEFLEKIDENMDKYNKVSIFANKDGFTYRNSEKTVEDFSDRTKEELVLGNYIGMEYFFQFTITDYLLVLLLIGLCMQFVTEKRNGLLNVIHSTANGRARLAAKRVGIIAVISFLAIIVLYGANIVLALQIYGGTNELSNAIQCIEQYMKVDESYNIRTFLIYYMSGKYMGMLAISLFTYLMVTAISDTTVGVLIIGLVGAIEYILYTKIPVQSSFIVFKYINLFSMVDYENVAGLYVNVNIFGQPVDIHLLLLVMDMVGIAIMIPGVIWVGARKYPNGRENILGIVIDKITEGIAHLVSKMHFLGFELFKNCVFQGGLMITIIMLIVAHDGIRSSSYKSYDKVNTYLNHFYKEKEGADIKEVQRYIAEQEQDIKKSETELSTIEESYASGKITYSEYINQSAAYDFLKDKRDAVDLFAKRISKLQKYEVETGVKISVVNPNGYTMLLGSDSYKTHRAFACKVLLFLVLFVHLLFVYEKQTKAYFLVRATVRGRGGFFTRKVLQIILVSGILVCVFFGVELYNINMVYGMPGLDAAVGSIECLQYMKSDLSIRQFMGLLFIVRWLVLVGVGMMVLLLSVLSKKREQALWGAIVLFVIPTVLVLIGVKQARMVSFSSLLSVVELLGNQPVIRTGVIIPYLTVMAIAIICITLTKKIWCKGTVV